MMVKTVLQLVFVALILQASWGMGSLDRFGWLMREKRDLTSQSTCVSRLCRGGDSSASPLNHRILGETVLHNQWRKLRTRQVELPSKATAEFEIISQGDRGGTVSDEAVLVFVWDRHHKTAVLVKEYMPALHRFMHGLAAGMVEEKHQQQEKEDNGDTSSNAVETAARHELEEECRLTGGEWHRLCVPTAMDKYTTTRLSVYLVLDPIPIDEANAKPRDELEEGMIVVHGVTVQDLYRHMTTGEMTVVGGWATQLALTKLRELGEI